MGFADGPVDGVHVLTVGHVEHLPAVSLEALPAVFGEGDIGGAFNGDVVVVVEVDQLAQLHVAGQRGGFGCHAFHQVAVGDDGIRIMIDDVVAGAVENGRQMGLGDSHADAVGESLA